MKSETQIKLKTIELLDTSRSDYRAARGTFELRPATQAKFELVIKTEYSVYDTTEAALLRELHTFIAELTHWAESHPAPAPVKLPGA